MLEQRNIGIEWHLQYPLDERQTKKVPCSSLLKTPPPTLCSNLRGQGAADRAETSQNCQSFVFAKGLLFGLRADLIARESQAPQTV
jgi:hypothetical protein